MGKNGQQDPKIELTHNYKVTRVINLTKQANKEILLQTKQVIHG